MKHIRFIALAVGTYIFLEYCEIVIKVFFNII